MLGARAAAAEASGEDGEAADEEPPAAEAVAEGGAGEQEHREGQRVGVDRPLEAGDAGVQVVADGGQRRGHDQVVERDHEQRDRGDDEGPDGARGRAAAGGRVEMRWCS